MADLTTISLTETDPTKIHSALRQVIEKSMGQQDASSNLATLSAPGSHRVFYSDSTEAISTAIIGVDTTIFASNGSTAAPSFRTLSNIGGVNSSRAVNAGGIATGGGDLSADRTITVTAATQSDQEAGTSSVTAVTPAVQHFGQSAAKAWALITWAAGTPVLTNGFNVSSVITDTGSGDFTIAYPTVFSSSTSYAPVANGHAAAGGMRSCTIHTQTASTTRFNVRFDDGVLTDPTAVSIHVFGDL